MFHPYLRLLADVGEDAAVHIQHMAVDEVGSVAGKEHRRTHKVLRGAPPRRRRLCDDELVERVAASVRLALPQRRRLRRLDVSRPDAVALDVVFAVLAGNVLRQHLQAALCSRIRAHRLAPQLAHHAADVDDLSVPLFDHPRDHRLAHDERRVQVHVHHLPELRRRHLAHGKTNEHVRTER